MSFSDFHPTLEKLGFSQAGPDTWGLVNGDLTLFIEGGDMGLGQGGEVVDKLSAWLIDGATGVYVGPMLEILGPTEAALNEALGQLRGLLQEEDQASLPRHDTPQPERLWCPERFSVS
jgi:hypothetical protein